jgi:protein-tyrosine phosphatase
MNPEDACEVAPRVFFGPASSTYDTNILKNFTHIINCDSYSSSTSTQGQLKKFLFLPSEDNEEFKILDKHFTTLFHFIEKALQDPNAKVFIHCYMGWNRSACLAVAYSWYLQHTSKSMNQVIEETRGKVKRDLLTNEDFVKQLFEFSSL